VLVFSAYIDFFYSGVPGEGGGKRLADMCQRGMWVKVLAPWYTL
jgi:hypothetical protein